MTDESHLWNYKPTMQRRPMPAEPLWSVRMGDVTWTCELRFQGDSVGWEAQILRDGELATARTFILRDLAVGWAKNERDRLEAKSASGE